MDKTSEAWRDYRIEKSQKDFMQSVEFAEEEPILPRFLEGIRWFASGFVAGVLLTVIVW